MSTDTEDRLLSALREKRGMRMRTGELEEMLKGFINCPDDIVRSLNILKRKGLVRSETDRDGATHIWWIE